MPATPVPHQTAVVLGLATATGVVDATAFLHLGGVFNSVVTGSMVVFGLSVAASDWATTLRAGASLVAYVAGVAGGARLSGRLGQRTPPMVAATAGLVVELGLLVALWAAWLGTAGHPGGGAQLPLIVLGGTAMGIQSTAVTTLGRPGLSTTYLTGALTRIVSGTADPTRSPGVDRLQVLTFAAVVAGALVGALLDAHARPIGPLAGALCVVGAVVVLRSGRPTSTPPGD